MSTGNLFRASDGTSTTRDSEIHALYRALLVRSLPPAEAANLTAFLCGIPLGNQPWTIVEINRLLFLRQLFEAGQFRPTAGQ